MVAEPPHHRHTFLYGFGETRLGRERIFDADTHDAGSRGVFAHDAVVRFEAEEGPPTTMKIDERGLRPVGAGVVCADQHLSRAYRHPAIGSRRHFRTAGSPGRT